MAAYMGGGAAPGGARPPHDSDFDGLGLDPELVEDLGDQLEMRGDVAEAELEEATSELEAAVARANEYQDRFVRLQAEWDNFRKRSASEQETQRIRANEKLVEALLPVIDDMERALEHAGEGTEVASFADGIRAVHTKFLSALASVSVEVIDPVDVPFDANLHNAVQRVENPDVFDETVVTCIQKGYMMGGYVIRPAMVVVSAGGPARPVEPKQ